MDGRGERWKLCWVASCEFEVEVSFKFRGMISKYFWGKENTDRLKRDYTSAVELSISRGKTIQLLENNVTFTAI